jgi:hypothetical protein
VMSNMKPLGESKLNEVVNHWTSKAETELPHE